MGFITIFPPPFGEYVSFVPTTESTNQRWLGYSILESPDYVKPCLCFVGFDIYEDMF